MLACVWLGNRQLSTGFLLSSHSGITAQTNAPASRSKVHDDFSDRSLPPTGQTVGQFPPIVVPGFGSAGARCMLAAMSDAAQLLRAAIQLLRQSPEQAPAADAAELALHLLESDASFGDLLRQHRDAAGLSVSRLAKLAKLSENTIKNIEAGRNSPTTDTMTRILGVAELRLPSEQSEIATADWWPE